MANEKEKDLEFAIVTRNKKINLELAAKIIASKVQVSDR